MTVLVSDLSVLISTHEPFVIFSLPCPVEVGSDRVALVGTWCPTRVNSPQACSSPAPGSKHAWVLTAGKSSSLAPASSPVNGLGPSAVSHFEIVWGSPGG